jgi:hypothetical protein
LHRYDEEQEGDMTKFLGLVGVAVLAGTTACGGAPEDDRNVNAPAEEVPQSVGTSGTGNEAQPPTDAPAAVGEANLPATASPLPLYGGLGVVLVGAGFALRRLRGGSQ